ncbi:MAG: hypothetical protein ACI8RZ_003690 [Myxococcota bacterium]|jgi:hypothetical protein
MRSWNLTFHIKPEASPPLESIVSSIEAGLGTTLSVRWSPWSGNPREYCSQIIDGTAEIQAAGALFVRADLARRTSRTSGIPEHYDASRVLVVLAGDDVPAMDRIWARTSEALGVLGYADVTLAGAPADIVDALAEAGEVERVAVMRREITDALVEKVASGPPHWPLVVGFSRPDDMERILQAAPSPGLVRTIALNGCGLTRLPALLLDEPGFFPALENLDLAHNPLEVLPPLKPHYPKLTHVGLEHCPSLALDPADWKGVTVSR